MGINGQGLDLEELAIKGGGVGTDAGVMEGRWGRWGRGDSGDSGNGWG
jgi:hypothetical protein